MPPFSPTVTVGSIWVGTYTSPQRELLTFPQINFFPQVMFIFEPSRPWAVTVSLGTSPYIYFSFDKNVRVVTRDSLSRALPKMLKRKCVVSWPPEVPRRSMHRERECSHQRGRSSWIETGNTFAVTPLGQGIYRHFIYLFIYFFTSKTFLYYLQILFHLNLILQKMWSTFSWYTDTISYRQQLK